MPDQEQFTANPYQNSPPSITQPSTQPSTQPGNAHSQYLEAEVLSADPVQLISLLYRGALEAVTAARAHLQERDIRRRTRRINQAYEILFELIQSLDHTLEKNAGGEISQNLARLYAYMQTRLLEANSQQIEAPLTEVENLLTTLAEAWKAVPAISPVTDSPAISADAAAAEYVPMSCTY